MHPYKSYILNFNVIMRQATCKLVIDASNVRTIALLDVDLRQLMKTMLLDVITGICYEFQQMFS